MAPGSSAMPLTIGAHVGWRPFPWKSFERRTGACLGSPGAAHRHHRGYPRLLRRVARTVREGRPPPDDLLVSVGDLVDRGPAPGEVVRLFRERPNSVVVMGNHERKHVRGIFSYAQEITR